MLLHMKPEDLLFFRDGRPFQAGEGTLADGSALPGPGVFAGALRTAYLASHLPSGQTLEGYGKAKGDDPGWKDIHAKIGTPEKPDPFQLKGPFIVNQDDILFPFPHDLLEGQGALAALVPLRDSPSPGPQGLLPLWAPGEIPPGEAAGDALPSQSFVNYLQGNSVFCSASYELMRDVRVGLQLVPETRKAETGKLYEASYLSMPENMGFLVDVNFEHADMADAGFLKLGGEMRAANYRQRQANEFNNWDSLISQTGVNRTNIRDKFIKTGRLKLYLATSAVFTQGWRPDWFAADNNSLSSEGGLPAGMMLVSAAVGKPVLVSGWNIATGKAKSLSNAVPAGSVFFLECAAGVELDRGALFDRLHYTTALQTVSDSSLARLGYGLTFCGVWDYLKTEGV